MQNKEQPSICFQEIGCEPDVKGYRILIKAVELPEKSKGGLLLTESYKNMERRTKNLGRVLKIGPTAFTDRFEDRRVDVGDWILYSIYEREEVYPNDKLCYFINDERVYAAVKEQDLPSFIKEIR